MTIILIYICRRRVFSALRGLSDYECSTGVYSIIQWIATAISLQKLEQIAFRLVLHLVPSVLIPPFYYH